jgi:dienelactone hydrolase
MRHLPALALTLAAATAHPGERVKFEASRGYTAQTVSLRAEIAKPEGDGPFPAVVLMHGCGGWQPAVRYTMQAYSEFLVNNGFVVLDLDSFGPRNLGGGKVCESVDRQVDALDYRTHDAEDALEFLQAQRFVEPRSVFLMGQSNGGSVAINVAKGDGPHGKRARSPGFRAVVAYYPWCGSFGYRKVVGLAAPLLVFAGAQDDWVPASECEGVRSTGAPLQVIVYPTAAHSFDLDILPQRYLGKLIGKDEHAAGDSRRRMLSFFVEHAAGFARAPDRVAKN